MALTTSTMRHLRTPAPDFMLADVVSGRQVSLAEFEDKRGLLVMFICNHCPYVRHVLDELANIGREYIPKGIGIVAVSANDVRNYPDDSPENLKEMAEKYGLNFPVCHDETQEVAKAYSAACTPDFFLFDKDFLLVYRGQLDDSRPGNNLPVTGQDLRYALDQLLTHSGFIASVTSVLNRQRPSSGCNIKWKPGNEPDYGIYVQPASHE